MIERDRTSRPAAASPHRCPFCGGELVARGKMLHTTQRGTRAQACIETPRKRWFCLSCKRSVKNEA